jgi:hypothetical protein
VAALGGAPQVGAVSLGAPLYTPVYSNGNGNGGGDDTDSWQRKTKARGLAKQLPRGSRGCAAAVALPACAAAGLRREAAVAPARSQP